MKKNVVDLLTDNCFKVCWLFKIIDWLNKKACLTDVVRQAFLFKY